MREIHPPIRPYDRLVVVRHLRDVLVAALPVAAMGEVDFDEALAEVAKTSDGPALVRAATEAAQEIAAGRPVDDEARRIVERLAVVVAYGGPRRPGARAMGYDPGATRSPGAPIVHRPLRATPFAAIVDRYDVIVVGAGVGGATATHELAAAGARVLCCERGEVGPDEAVGRVHVANHRHRLLGQNSGPDPDGNPRRAILDGATVEVERPHDPRWQGGAMIAGGGSRLYQAMAFRFAPEDFAMARTYGMPEGGSLADWPFGLDELADHYRWAEATLGVAGRADAHPALGPHPGYPLPPMPPTAAVAALTAGARALGWQAGPAPLALNTVPADGRAACVACGECVGFTCQSNARSGVHNTVLPRALDTGLVDLIGRCRATRVRTDASGRVVGIEVLDERTGERRDVAAHHVVVAAGAIETARLLRTSPSVREPDGLGNGSDQLGRHLQGHPLVSAFGMFDDPIADRSGPGAGIATLDHLHGTDGLVGGGMVSLEMPKLPALFWDWARHPDAPRTGSEAVADVAHAYPRTVHLFALPHVVSQAADRVTIGDRTDAHGIPVATLAGSTHPATAAAADHLLDAAVEWLRASGARTTWRDPAPTGLHAGTHQSGTCRMGEDPASSVTDPWGRVHGHDNLWVADASVLVTDGAVGPSLTVMALAHRQAARLLSG